jgi:hypothetical protein
VNTLLAVAFLLFTLLAILSLIMPVKLGFFLKKPTRLKVAGAYLAAAVLAATIGSRLEEHKQPAPGQLTSASSAPTNSTSTAPASAPIPAKPAEPSKAPTPEETLEEYKLAVAACTRRTLGRETNWQDPVKRIENIDLNYLYNKKGQTDGVHVNLSLNMNENLTTNMTRTGMFMDIWKLMHAIFTDTSLYDIKSVYVNGKLMLVDKYGKKSSDVVIKLAMTRQIADKLNWDDVLIDNYRNIFDEARKTWLHPALR